MKVLLIILNPIIRKQRLSDYYNVDVANLHSKVLQEWNKITEENYIVVDTIVADWIPDKEDGYQYTPEEYFNVLTGKKEHHSPDYLNYKTLIDKFDLINKKNNGDFEEVHLYGFPWQGAFESRMIGRNSIWCNAPLYNADTDNFIIMGLNAERGVSEAIEAFSHRVESTLDYCYPKFWKKFLSVVGSVHIPHNGNIDYDWSNKTMKLCYADMFPNSWNNNSVPVKKGCNIFAKLFSRFKIDAPEGFKPVLRNCEAWKCNSLDYFRYWYQHIPKEMFDVIVHPDKINIME
jgi:hypothetical protein